MKLGFGPYKNRDIETLPTSYLKWSLANIVLSDGVHKAVDEELELREKEGSKK